MVCGSHDWGGVLADGGTDTHEEAMQLSVLDASMVTDLRVQGGRSESNIPESGTRSKHILSQAAHNTVWSSTVSHDVNGSEDESHNSSDSCAIYQL